MLSALGLIVTLTHGGLLSDAPPRGVTLVEDLASGQATRQDLNERLAVLEDSKPSKTGPLAVLIGGGALVVASYPIASSLGFFAGATELTVRIVFLTCLSVGAAAAIVGVVWLLTTLSTRHRIDVEIKDLQQQLQPPASPPPLPPSVLNPGPEFHWQLASF